MTQMVWTKAEITEFDALIESQSSRGQMDRIEGRLGMSAFVKEHGKPKCDAMFAHLQQGGDLEDCPSLPSRSPM